MYLDSCTNKAGSISCRLRKVRNSEDFGTVLAVDWVAKKLEKLTKEGGRGGKGLTGVLDRVSKE